MITSGLRRPASHASVVTDRDCPRPRPCPQRRERTQALKAVDERTVTVGHHPNGPTPRAMTTRKTDENG